MKVLFFKFSTFIDQILNENYIDFFMKCKITKYSLKLQLTGSKKHYDATSVKPTAIALGLRFGIINAVIYLKYCANEREILRYGVVDLTL